MGDADIRDDGRIRADPVHVFRDLAAAVHAHFEDHHPGVLLRAETRQTQTQVGVEVLLGALRRIAAADDGRGVRPRGRLADASGDRQLFHVELLQIGLRHIPERDLRILRHQDAGGRISL